METSGRSSISPTIVSGSVAERIKFSSYMLTAFITSAVAYPIFGHWAWGGLLEGKPTGWLAELGFLDFAGSTVVHSLGGWMSLAVCLMIGPPTVRVTVPAVGIPEPVGAEEYLSTTSLALIQGRMSCGLAGGGVWPGPKSL